MLTPHEFKRTRAARPRPDLGGDDLADLGTTCWCVGRISTDKHLSIGKAHAVLPKTGLYWPPVVARVGRRPWRCRCGLPYWWPPVLADAVAVRRAGDRSVWLVYWLAVLAAGVRPPCWRSVRGWCPSVAVVTLFVAAGGLSAVRWSIGPPWSFCGPWRPVFGPCQWWAVAARGWLVCLPCQYWIGPPTSGRPVAGRWSVLAVPCVLGVAGLAVGAGWPSGWPVLIRAARGPCWLAVLIRPPSVALSASAGPWPVVALAGPCGGLVGRRWCPCTLWSFRGPCGPCFGPCQWWASRWPCGVRAGVPVAADGVPVSARVGRAGRGVLALRVVSFPVFQ